MILKLGVTLKGHALFFSYVFIGNMFIVEKLLTRGVHLLKLKTLSIFDPNNRMRNDSEVCYEKPRTFLAFAENVHIWTANTRARARARAWRLVEQ